MDFFFSFNSSRYNIIRSSIFILFLWNFFFFSLSPWIEALFNGNIVKSIYVYNKKKKEGKIGTDLYEQLLKEN